MGEKINGIVESDNLLSEATDFINQFVTTIRLASRMIGNLK